MEAWFLFPLGVVIETLAMSSGSKRRWVGSWAPAWRSGSPLRALRTYVGFLLILVGGLVLLRVAT